METECPICLETKQIYSLDCNDKHKVCSECRSQISSCPLCRAKLKIDQTEPVGRTRDGGLRITEADLLPTGNNVGVPYAWRILIDELRNQGIDVRLVYNSEQ
jgi:hypothetical protein